MRKALALIVLLTVFVSCSTDSEKEETPSIKLNTNLIEIYYDEEFIIDAETNPIDEDIIWITENENVAEVSQTGEVEAIKVGETTIKVKTIQTEALCEVIIKPYRNLYKAPVVTFGESESFVKSKETRPYLGTEDDILFYSDPNSKVEAILYFFVNNKLEEAGVILNLYEKEMDDLALYLDERYFHLGTTDDGVTVFEYENMLIGIMSIDTDLVVVYIPSEELKSASIEDYDFASKIQALKAAKVKL